MTSTDNGEAGDRFDPGLSKRFMKEASEFLAGGDAARGLEALRSAWAHDPFNEELPLMCATLQLRGGDAIRAAHLAVDALNVRPFYPAALDVLGVACVDALQPELAISVLGKAIAMAPELPNPKQNLESARQSKRDLAQAGVPEAEILRSAQLLPQNGIRALLSGGKPRISAAIVLRDGQEEHVAACVTSVADVASETVLIDARRSRTGSVLEDPADVTVHEILHTHGVPFARTEALRRATGDWIILLDADETLEADPLSLARAVADPAALAHVVEVRSPGGGFRRLPLLVRNAPGLRFEAGLDRQLLPVLQRLEAQWGLRIHSDSEFALRSTRDAISTEVDWVALAQVIADDPENLEAQVARARVDLESGRSKNALEALREILGRLEQAGRERAIELEEPALLAGCCLMRLERYAELEALMQHYDQTLPLSASSQFLRGAAAKASGDFKRAGETLLEALELLGHATFAPPLAEVHGPGLPTLLGAALLDVGDLQLAEESFNTALEIDPKNVEAQLGIVALHLADGKVQTVLTDLDRLIEQSGANPTVWITGSVVLAHLPEFAATAVEWLLEAQRRFPWHVEIRQRLGEAQLRSGDAAAAIKTWATLDNEGTEPGALVVASLLSGASLPELAPDSGEQVRGQVLGWFNRLMSGGSLEALDQALLNLDRAEGVIPELKSRTAVWLESLGQHEAAANLLGAERPV